MSRNNSKTARQLREAEALESRKQILKASHNDASNKAELFEALANSGNQYMDKLEKLKSFKAKSKSVTKTATQKMEWERECEILDKSAAALTNELTNSMEVWVLHTMDDMNLHDIVHEMQSIQAGISENKRSIVNQFREIKGLLQDCIKGRAKTIRAAKQPIKGEKRPVASADEGAVDALHDPKYSQSECVFADFLLSLRQEHSERGIQLAREEERLSRELSESNRQLMTSWRADSVSMANQELQQLVDSIDVCDSMGAGSNVSLNGGQREEIELMLSEWSHRMQLLEKNYDTACKLVDTEKEAVCLQLGIVDGLPAVEGDAEYEELEMNQLSNPKPMFNIEAATQYGGWTADDHNLFVKIYKESRRGANAISGRSVLASLLQTQLPHRSSAELSTHEEWYRAMKSLGQKKAELTNTFTANCAELVRQAKEAMLEHRQQLIENAIRDEKIQQHEKCRLELHHKLQEMKLEKMVKDELLSKEERERAEEMRQKHLEQVRLAKAEAEQKRQEVEEYRRRKEEDKRREDSKLEELQKLEREKIRSEIESNRQNVEHRQLLLREKEMETKKQAEQLQIQENKRLDALMALASQVPYWDSIQNVESKLDHVTAAVRAQEYISDDTPGIRGHLPLNGFADNKIIKDARFRLATALRAAGIQHSEAARQIVSNTFHRPHLAIHGIL